MGSENVHSRFDHRVEPVQLLPRRGYILVARGKATQERHPGLGNDDQSPSANKSAKKNCSQFGRSAGELKEGTAGKMGRLGRWALLYCRSIVTDSLLPGCASCTKADSSWHQFLLPCSTPPRGRHPFRPASSIAISPDYFCRFFRLS